MKKIIVLLAIFSMFMSCKKETCPECPEFQGEFIYLEDGAVIKGDNFIYGITLDDMAKKLAEKVEPVKKEEFDMVPVVVKGTVSKKPDGQEGWDEILTIKEIVSVSDTPSEADIKIEESKN